LNTKIALSNRLTVLAAEIKALHTASEAALQTSIEKATKAGELLIEAKDEVPHGQWLPWLQQVGVPTRTAQRYMQLARVKYDTVSHLGIKAALAEIAHRRSTLLELSHALNDFVDALQKPLNKDQAETFSDLLAALIKAMLERLQEDLNFSDKELDPWFYGLGPAPAILQRMRNHHMTKADCALFDAIDLDEWREAAALQNEICAKLERMVTR
jgi:hypothetical protein